MASTYALLGLALPRIAAVFIITHAGFACAQGSTTPATTPTTPTTPPLTFIDEIEPNDTRLTATPMIFATAQTRLRGRTTGSAGTGDTSSDFWNITLPGINPQAITLHRLLIDVEPLGPAPGPLGHTGVVMATRVNRSTTPPTNFDNLLQYTTVNSNPPRASVFYSLNASSLNFDYRITGTNSTATRYILNWQREVITPEIIGAGACAFPSGPITITTIGQGHQTDTQLFLFDATTYALIAQMDNPPLPNSPRQAELTVNLQGGRYILAVAPSGVVTNQFPPESDLASQAVNQLIVPSAGMYIHPSSAINLPLTFKITGDFRSETINARRSQAFAMQFYLFTVQQRCGEADLSENGAGPCVDGVLDNNDFIAFVSFFFSQNPRANLATSQFPGEPETWDNEDFIRFIQLFFGSCDQ